MGFYEDELDPSFNEGDCGECGGHCGDQDCVCRTLRHIVELKRLPIIMVAIVNMVVSNH